jgi:hypothetical protein
MAAMVERICLTHKNHNIIWQNLERINANCLMVFNVNDLKVKASVVLSMIASKTATI